MTTPTPITNIDTQRTFWREYPELMSRFGTFRRDRNRYYEHVCSEHRYAASIGRHSVNGNETIYADSRQMMYESAQRGIDAVEYQYDRLVAIHNALYAAYDAMDITALTETLNLFDECRPKLYE